MYKRFNLIGLLALITLIMACGIKWIPYGTWLANKPEQVLVKIQTQIDRQLENEAYVTELLSWNKDQKIRSAPEISLLEKYENLDLNYFLVEDSELTLWSKAAFLPSDLTLLLSLQSGYFRKDEVITFFKTRTINTTQTLVITKTLSGTHGPFTESDNTSFALPLLNGKQVTLALTHPSSTLEYWANFLFFISLSFLWLIFIKNTDEKYEASDRKIYRPLIKSGLLVFGLMFFLFPDPKPLWLASVLSLPLLEIISRHKLSIIKSHNAFLITLGVALLHSVILLSLAFFCYSLTHTDHFYSSIVTDILLHSRLIPNFGILLLFGFIATYILHEAALRLKNIKRSELIVPFSISLLLSAGIYYTCISTSLIFLFLLFSSLSALLFLLYIRRSKLNYSWLLTWIILLSAYLSLHINHAWQENDKNYLAEIVKKTLHNPSLLEKASLVNEVISKEKDIRNLFSPVYPSIVISDLVQSSFTHLAQSKGYSGLPEITSILAFDNRFRNISDVPAQFTSPFLKSFIQGDDRAIHYINDKGYSCGIYKHQSIEENHPYHPITSLVSYKLGKANTLSSDYAWTAKYKGHFIEKTGVLVNTSRSVPDNHRESIHVEMGNISQQVMYRGITTSSLITVFSILMSLSLVLLLAVALVNSYAHFLPANIDFFISGKNSLRYKIQFSLLASIIGSFLLIAIVSIYNITKTYKQSHENGINQAVEAFNFHYHGIPLISALSDGDKELMTDITNFEKIHNCVISAFDIDGKRLLPNHNNKRVVENINPRAYWGLKTKGRNVLFLSSNNFSPFSSQRVGYLKLNGPSKKNVGFVQISSPSESSILSEKISQFASSLLNIYILLFLMAGGVAIALANSITKPLEVIGNNLKNLKLGKKQAPLKWNNNDELGSLVRNYNLTVDKLEESAKLLAITERESAWREMAKQIAHEIKNPLTPMKLSIQHLKLAASRSDNLDIKDMIDRVSSTLLQQIESLSEIATEFSSFAHFPKPDNQTVILNEVIATTHDLFRKRDDIDINLYVPIDEIYVFADKNFLLRVFNNLLKNAIQSIPLDRRGKVDIHLKKANGQAIVEINDNGIGIPKEMYEKIFTPNFTTKSSGTGLGLAISSNIIESFNGQIYFETTKGHGTTFFVELPLMLKKDNYKLFERVTLS